MTNFITLFLLTATDGYEDYTPTPVAADIRVPLFVTIAYSAMWIAILCYVWYLRRQQKRLAHDIDQLHNSQLRDSQQGSTSN